MSKPEIKIVNCESGEETIREATNAEIAQFKKDVEISNDERSAKAQKEVARQAILDRLGLTADEAKLLLG